LRSFPTRRSSDLVMVRIEVCSRGRKRWIAFPNLVQVHGVLTRLDALQSKLDEQPAAGFHQLSSSDVTTFLVLELRLRHKARFGAICRNKRREQQARAEELQSHQSVHHGPPFVASW